VRPDELNAEVRDGGGDVVGVKSEVVVGANGEFALRRAG
jgi:hypothetical protein